jgi:hypothetical protein
MTEFQFDLLMATMMLILRELRDGKDPRWIWTVLIWLWLGTALADSSLGRAFRAGLTSESSSGERIG